MTQAIPTSCGHNAPGQVLVPGVPVPCRQCGAIIEPSPRTVNAGGQLVAGEKQVNAAYPGDARTADTSWVFGQ